MMLKLKKKIKQGMTELKLSQSGLSKAIEHSRNYLSECLRVGVSTEKQGVIIGKIDGLLKPKEISIDVSDKDDEQHYSHWVGKDYHNQEIAKLNFKLSGIKDELNELVADAEIIEKENGELKEIRDNLVIECNELQQGLNRACDQLHKESQKMRDAEKRAEYFHDVSNKYRSEKAEMYKQLNAWRFLAWIFFAIIATFVFAWVVG